MAFLSLEEAAKKLGMSEDALRGLAKDKKIRSMLDSGKLIFKDTEVDAYLAKNPPTAETRIPADEDLVLNLGDDSSGDSFGLEGSSGEHPILMDEGAEQSGDSLVLDDSSGIGLLPDEEQASNSGDNLVLDDSSGIGLLPDDIDLSAAGGNAEQTMMISPESDSDSGSSDVRGVAAAPGDSSSDFDLDPGQGSDSEFTLGSDALNFPSGEDSASGTGLNIDDGSSGTFMLDESSSIFELEASEAIDGGSDSNFEINLEDSSGMVEGGDIPVDEEGELAVEDSGDQVVALDEEGDVNAETVAAPSRRRKSTLLEEEPIEAIDEPLMDSGDDDDGEAAFAGGAAAVAGAGMIAAPSPWGPLPALVLLPTVIGLVLLTLMSFEILNSVIGFFNGTKTSTLILKPMMEFIDPASAKLLD